MLSNMLGWKQVDLIHAGLLAVGSLRLGRLADYATLENGRADIADGSVEFAAQTLLAGVPEHRTAMTRLGMRAGAILASRFVHQSPPLYALCLSECGCDYDPSPEIEKAVFQVNALHMLAYRLVEKHHDRIIGAEVRRVKYERRSFDALERLAAHADPFIKLPSFAREREIRIVFLPRPDTAFEPLHTDPDPVIAGLLSRLR